MDTRDAGQLEGTRAFVVGYKDEKLGALCKGGIAGGTLDPSELPRIWLSSPKVAAPISLESTKNFHARWRVFFELDSFFNQIRSTSIYSIKALLPYGNRFFSNHWIDPERLRLAKKHFSNLFSNPALEHKKTIAKLSQFLATESTHPSLSKQVVFDSDRGTKKEAQVRVVYPDIQEGDGVIEPWDVGAGVYAICPCTGETLFSGIAVATCSETYNHIDFEGTNRVQGALIIPVKYLWTLYEKLCHGKKAESPEEEVETILKQMGVETSPKKPKKAASTKKQTRKNKKKTSSKASLSPSPSPSFSEERVDPQTEASGPLTDDSGLDKEENPSQGIAQVQAPQPVQPESPSLRERLQGTTWTGIVIKRALEQTPYKELYTFIFSADGTCLHHVALLRHQIILGNHVSQGRWSLDERDGDPHPVLSVNLSLMNQTELQFQFLVHSEGDTLVCQEIRSEEEEREEILRTGKQRTPISLREVKDISSKDPLSLFDIRERYEGMISDFARRIWYKSSVFRRYGMPSVKLEDLEGDWVICGIQRSAVEATPLQENSKKLTVFGDVAFYQGTTYDARVTVSYDIRDQRLKRPAYSLHLLPIDREQRPVTLAIFRSENGQVLLATPRVCLENPLDGSMRLLYPSRFFVRWSF
jgi:hypothetical protein